MKITKKVSGMYYIFYFMKGFKEKDLIQVSKKRNPLKISIIYILPIYKPHTSQLLVKNCKIVENNAKNSLCKRCVASALNAAKC